MRAFWHGVWVIWRKDLARERRTRDVFAGMAVFVLLAGVMFSFALDAEAGVLREVFPGLLWLAIFFGGSLAVGRSFASEREQQALSGMLLAPVDRSAVFFGKALANLTVLLTVEAVGLPAFLILFDVSLGSGWPWVLASLALGTVGFALLATLLAAITAPARTRDVLMPLLLLPLGTPLLLAAVETTAVAVAGSGAAGVGLWYRLLFVYVVIFSVLPMMLIDYVLEE